MNKTFNAYQYLREHPHTWNDIFFNIQSKKHESLTTVLMKDCVEKNNNPANFTKQTYSTLKIVLKTKDEAELLEPWIIHHAKLVGFENIIIFDHSSTSKAVHAIYKKYKDKLLVLSVPETIDHDSLHNTRTHKYIFDVIKQNCLFFTLIDTDEFLCWNNGRTLKTKGLTKELQKYAKHQSVSTTWLHNYFTENINPDVTSIKDFDVREHSMVANVLNGKAIFRSDKQQPGISHNKAALNHTVTTPFILLHLKHRNIEDRIKTQINYCKSKGLLPQNISHEAMITTLTSLVTNEGKQKHPVHEILDYYADKESYIKKLQSYDRENVLHSTVVANTILNKPLQYSFTSKTFRSLDTAIEITFKNNIEKWKKPGAYFVPRISFFKIIMNNLKEIFSKK